MAAGIRTRHGRSCRSREGGRCNCSPSYEAWVYSKRDGKKIRKTFPDLASAKGWRSDAEGAVRRRTLRAPTKTTVAEAAEVWLQGARVGTVRNRSGDRYKPSALRGYERSLRLRVKPELGHARLAAVTRGDVQGLVDKLLGEGLDPSTIRNTLNPLQAIYRRALTREQVAVNPTVGLEIPASRGRRDRIAEPVEGAALIESLPAGDRALWATAMYAGLRRGELRGLRWTDIDLEGGVIRVEHGWDDSDGEIQVKTRSGRRSVPILSRLRRELVAHKLLTGRDGDALVFGTTSSVPFEPSTVRRRALAAWEPAEGERMLEPIGLHEARHTFASLLIAAGVNAKALSSDMGHASVTITYDRYGHLMPGNEEEAASLADAYLERALTP